MAEKSAPEGGDVDLFGDPWTHPRDPRGRKAHKRSPQLAEKIAVLRGSGSTEEEIEARVGLTVKTLRKYYSRELEKGPTLSRAMLDEVMYAKAMAGNVSAARYMDQRFKEGDASLAAQRMKARAEASTEVGQSRPVTVEKIGKKAERQAAAEELAGTGGKYAPPAAPGRPKLVASNP